MPCNKTTSQTKNPVILSGAGMRAECCIKAFRDDDGLWHTHRFGAPASRQAWEPNPQQPVPEAHLPVYTRIK